MGRRDPEVHGGLLLYIRRRSSDSKWASSLFEFSSCLAASAVSGISKWLTAHSIVSPRQKDFFHVDPKLRLPPSPSQTLGP